MNVGYIMNIYFIKYKSQILKASQLKMMLAIGPLYQIRWTPHVL